MHTTDSIINESTAYRLRTTISYVEQVNLRLVNGMISKNSAKNDIITALKGAKKTIDDILSDI